MAAFEEKNSFWKLRSKHGRDKIFADPQILLDAASEYFDMCDNTPWYKQEAIKGGDAAGTLIKIPTQKPYTLKGGLCHFLDIDFQTWLNYKEYPNFKPVMDRIEEFIYNQKFEGATVGVFNANIIARELGLVDKKDIETGGESLNKGFYDFVKQANTKKPDEQ